MRDERAAPKPSDVALPGLEETVRARRLRLQRLTRNRANHLRATLRRETRRVNNAMWSTDSLNNTDLDTAARRVLKAARAWLERNR